MNGGDGMGVLWRDGGVRFSNEERETAMAKAGRWTREQGDRLGYTPREIWAAVSRAWLPEEIEALAVVNAAELEGPPARVREAREGVRRKVAAAPVLPVVLHRPGPRHHA